jgi:GT2 family glycosyltransferase
MNGAEQLRALVPESRPSGAGARTARVTVVLLNYNGRSDLEACVSSLRADAERGGSEILVADNGSSDGSVQWLEREQPWVRVLAHGRNWGFAQGINRTLAAVRTPYFALLNNDTEVEDGWLEPLVDVLDEAPDVAAVQARIMLHDRRHLIQSAGGGVTRDGYGYDRGFWRLPGPPWDRPAEVFFVSAGAALFRRTAWADVGPFDPAFFMYHEDVDWSWRAWLAGWRLLYEPRSVVYHKMGVTTSRVLGFSARQALGERHRIRTLLKLGALPEALARAARPLRTRDRRRAVLLLRCILWNLWHLPATLWHRARTPVRSPRTTVERRLDAGPRPAELLASYRPATLEILATRGAPGRAGPVCELRAGSGDEALLGHGWDVPEPAWPGGPLVRWMADEAELLGWAPAAGGRIVLELLGAPGREATAGGAALGFAVETRGAERPDVTGFRLAARERAAVELSLPAGDAQRPFLVRLWADTVERAVAAESSTHRLATIGLEGYRIIPAAREG